nr:hypothetical protein [uncultured Sphaerochaeta sp.]
MKPVLIISGVNKESNIRYIRNINHRALQTANIIEALKVTKYIAPGMVISHELLKSNELKLITYQIFNNPLTPCIPSIFYNTTPDLEELSNFFNKNIPRNSNHIFIDANLSKTISGKFLYYEYVGTFN